MRIEYVNHEIDRSKWASAFHAEGEPDKVQWIDEATDLDCLINRGPSGALCGYVGVPKGHPLHGVDYSDVKKVDGEYIDVHGGLTFADSCGHSDNPYKGVCHIPQQGRPDDVWWLGFDCAHSDDICPSYDRGSSGYDSYKGIRYVEEEVKGLAAQLAAHTATP